MNRTATNVTDVAGRVLISILFLVSGFGKIAGYAGTQAYMAAMGVPGALLPIVIALAPGVIVGTVLVSMVNPDWLKFITYVTLLPLILLQAAGFRRPLQSANLAFVSTVMFDARETFPDAASRDCLAETTTCFASIHFDLAHQANGATLGHAQAAAGSALFADHLADAVDHDRVDEAEHDRRHQLVVLPAVGMHHGDDKVRVLAAP